MKHLLVIDDEIGSRESLKAVFSGRHRVSLAASADEALKKLSAERVDLVLLDIMMPEKDGLVLLKEVQALYPDLPVIMVSAATSVRPVVEAIREGAYDYVTKPFDVEEIRRMVDRALESSTLQRRVEILENEVSQHFPLDSIVGDSLAFRQALAHARKAAETDSTVLISGESGTGKELAARYIHQFSGRRTEPFVAVHCAAIPEPLMESELFGYEKGAFTNADKQKLGRFDLAGSGTLFFDEVSETAPTTQVKLLRVLQEREYMRIGGTRVIRTNARLVAATAKDLRREVQDKRFRDDLYYRLSVVPIHLPPLRERAGDVPLLARHFLNHFRQALDAATTDLEPEALDLMCRYPWPGNIRELRNIIERMLVLHGREEKIRAAFLPEEFHDRVVVPPAPSTHTELARAVGEFERQLVEEALRKANGVQTKAAELLGTTRRILRYRMEKLDIDGSAFEG
ncbi:MAG: sigma-54-dependent Fis family transcriptional regulator [Kiritimatiellae bacterium]|nr:sigma-54-dependent Fis family transcriptional regulator [Kiritimatiellia bacterium]